MAIRAAELQVVIGANVSAAQRAIGSFSDFLRGAASSAVGFFASQVAQQGVAAVAQLGAVALESVMAYERLTFTLESLAAREILAAGNAATLSEALEAAGPVVQELQQWIEDLALTSPFAVGEVTAAFQDLMRYGFKLDAAKEMTQALLDVAAASGMTSEAVRWAAYAFGQMFAAGKVNMQDLRQLINAGIDVSSVLQEMGYSLADVGQESINSSEFIQKFIEVAQRDFAGATGRMATSLSGIVGALRDFKEIGLRELFGGIFESLQPVLQEFTDWLLGPGREALRRWGEILGEKITKLIVWLNNNLPTIYFVFKELYSALQPLVEAFSTWFASFKTDQLRDFGQVLLGVVREGILWFKENAVPGLIAVFDWLAKNGELVKGALLGIGAAILASIVPSLIAVLVNAAPVIATFAAFAAIGAVLYKAWEENWFGIRDITLAVWEWLKSTFSAVSEWLKTHIPAAVEFLKGVWAVIWPVIYNVVSSVWEKIKSAFEAVKNWLSVIFPVILGALRSTWQTIWNAIQSIIIAILPSVQGLIDAFEAAVAGRWYEFGAALRRVWDNNWKLTFQILQSALGWIKNALWNFLSFMVNFFMNLGRTIVSINWVEVGKQIVLGIINGLISMGEAVALALIQIMRAAIEAIKGFLGIQSPSKLFEEEIAGNIISGWVRGIEKGIPKLESTLSLAASASIPRTQVQQQFVSGPTFYGPVTLQVPREQTLRNFLMELR